MSISSSSATGPSSPSSAAALHHPQPTEPWLICHRPGYCRRLTARLAATSARGSAAAQAQTPVPLLALCRLSLVVDRREVVEQVLQHICAECAVVRADSKYRGIWEQCKERARVER
jgi:hypothetical protein